MNALITIKNLVMKSLKKHVLYLFLIQNLIAYSQTIEVQYQQIFKNASIELFKKYDLVLTDSLSIYIERDSNVAIKNEDNNDNQRSYNISLGKKKAENIYLDTKENFYFIETFFGKALKIKENNFANDWKMIDSTKYISNFKCKLATKYFRGRNYFVWYTDEIPTIFGPWKLNRLGGLILEARDEKNEFKINALGVKFTPKNDSKYVDMINQINALFDEKNEINSIGEIKNYIEDKNKIILNRIKQQLPRGMAMPKISSNCEDCDDSLEKY